MPKKRTAAPPVFTWIFESVSGVAGGAKTSYVTQLNQDGSLSCNCPGWIFCKIVNGKPKSCKHTQNVESEKTLIFSQWKNGETLPKLTPKDGSLSPPTTFGRVIEL